MHRQYLPCDTNPSVQYPYLKRKNTAHRTLFVFKIKLIVTKLLQSNFFISHEKEQFRFFYIFRKFYTILSNSTLSLHCMHSKIISLCTLGLVFSMIFADIAGAVSSKKIQAFALINPTEKNITSLLDHSEVDGLALQLSWAKIETSP